VSSANRPGFLEVVARLSVAVFLIGCVLTGTGLRAPGGRLGAGGTVWDNGPCSVGSVGGQGVYTLDCRRAKTEIPAICCIEDWICSKPGMSCYAASFAGAKRRPSGVLGTAMAQRFRYGKQSDETEDAMTAEASNVQGLANRVEKLERQNRRMKQAGTIILILAAAVVLMGQAPGTRTVEANEFVLRDADGRIRGWLGVRDDNPGLSLYGANGKPQVWLSAQPGGPLFSLYDIQERQRIMITAPEETPVIGFYDKNGKGRGALGMSGDTPSLLLVHSEGKMRVLLDAARENPGLALYDDDGKERLALLVDSVGSRLTLLDSSEKKRAIFSAKDDSAGIVLADPSEKPQIGLFAGGPAAGMSVIDGNAVTRIYISFESGNNKPHIVLSDANDRPVWRTPNQ